MTSRPGWKRAAFAALIGCAALMAGCARDRSWKVGMSAPEISVLDLNDKTVRLSDYRGKAVVLRFWATGCMACVAAMPELDDFSKTARENGLAVLAVNMGSPKELVEKFVKDLNLSYPVFLDPALIAAKKYGVSSAPTTFFIDRNGVARKAVIGEMTRAQFEKAAGGLETDLTRTK
ncbi:MAG: TlpA family protein disulfide reductase [Elusimicrobia bacterium]|nr:TlpA family protein disulfide reductase [Elusimicrobiota bacterium]